MRALDCHDPHSTSHTDDEVLIFFSHSPSQPQSQRNSSPLALMQMGHWGASLALKPRDFSSTATGTRHLPFPTLGRVSRAGRTTYRLLP